MILIGEKKFNVNKLILIILIILHFHLETNYWFMEVKQNKRFHKILNNIIINYLFMISNY